MSYLVLARKWRPNTFDEVVGQSHVTRTLKNAIELDRVAHALLFTGSRGVGKTSCARILAKALNCQHGPTVNPCGVCPACVEIGGGTSVDVFEIDGASNNSVEQIREIRESVKFLPTRGKRKMYIIDEVHMLSTSAFNALLKTLEEPPAHVLFVFATTEPHKIPDTIISRCQRYDFKRIPERDIVEAIGRIAAAEGIQVESAALHHIAREARGGMRDSLSLLDQVIAFCGNIITEAQTREVLGIADRQVLHALTAAVFAGDGQQALSIVDQLFRFGLDLQKFAAEFVQHLRDLMVVKVCPEPGRLVDVNEEEVAAMQALVAPVDPARIHRVFNALLKGADEVARSPFPKLVLEMALLRLCHQGPTLPLAEVLSGLARLESRLDQAVPDAPISPPTGHHGGGHGSSGAAGGFGGGPGGQGAASGGPAAMQSASPPRGRSSAPLAAAPRPAPAQPGPGPAQLAAARPSAAQPTSARPAPAQPAPARQAPVQPTPARSAAPGSGPARPAGPPSGPARSAGPAAGPARPVGPAHPAGPAAGPARPAAAPARSAGPAAGPARPAGPATGPARPAGPATGPARPGNQAARGPTSGPARPGPARGPAGSQRSPGGPARPSTNGNGEAPARKTFKRRPGAEAGEVDDFSGPPPTPRPPEALPRLEVKPRVAGVVPGGETGRRGGPSGSGGPMAPPGGGPAGGGAGGPGHGAHASGFGHGAHTLGPAGDERDEPSADEAMLAGIDPIDFDDDDLDRLATLIEAFKEVNALAAGQLEHSLYLIRFTPNVLEVAIEAQERERVGGQIDRLARLGRAAVGEDLELRVVPCDRRDPRIDPERNLYARRERLAAAEREARISSAQRAPIILRAVELLDAQIIDVHPN